LVSREAIASRFQPVRFFSANAGVNKKSTLLYTLFIYVVLKSDISEKIGEIIGEVGKWAEILE